MSRLPRSIPRATLPDKRRPMVQTKGVQWATSEDSNWVPFSVEEKKKKYKRVASNKFPLKSGSRDPKIQTTRTPTKRERVEPLREERVLRKMSVEEYLKPGLELPSSLNGVIPEDDDRISKQRYDPNTNDEVLALQNHLQLREKSITELFHNIAKKGEPLDKSSYNNDFPLWATPSTIHCREVFSESILREVDEEGNKYQQWLTIVIHNRNGFTTSKQLCEALELKHDCSGVVGGDNVDIIEGRLSSTQVFSLNMKVVSQRSIRNLSDMLQRSGLTLREKAARKEPHQPSNSFEVTFIIPVTAPENLISQHLQSQKDTNQIINFFGTNKTKYHIKGIESTLIDSETAFPIKQLTEGEKATAELVGNADSPKEILGVIIADLLWRHDDNYLRKHCLKKDWVKSTAKLSPKMHPLSKAVLMSLRESGFDAHSALVWLRARRQVEALGMGCFAAIWNYFARWRTMSEENSALVPGDIIDDNSQLLIPTLGVNDVDRPQPLHHIEVMRLILNKFNINRSYPFTELPEYFTAQTENRHLYIPLTSLSWAVVQRTVSINPIHLFVPFSRRYTSELSDFSEGKTLVVSLCVPSSSRLTTVLGQLLPSNEVLFKREDCDII
eukprot:TRINITY_DN3940_c0_g1_i1.p1 TRINITY_DN3940_c0_g1~~TRINITY_DN3940_c0_g1_i1.p1  ORF type:complete len:613 (+),score=145.25 TRINITY_DN3940_c0_g1_i1:834-2672(+)